jgi:acetate kinase
VDEGARRGRARHPRLDLAVLSEARVLVVNAGSTSLKLSVVDRDETSDTIESLAGVPGDVVAAGHRVVHGGDRFREPVIVDDAVKASLRELSDLAPLHNGPALEALDRAQRLLPDLPHVAVFDTAFHAALPAYAANYAVPARWREEWGIRRYGFHGLSVAWVAERVQAPRLVVCHLGGGCSVTAVLDGRSIDTTMGFSPLEGVPMATRSGSVDPGALLYLLRRRLLTLEELDHALEHRSGLAALGGLETPLGFEIYTYRIAQACAAMAAALGGVDALAFTGGVGENRTDVRDAIAQRLAFVGRFRVEVVPAREDVVVARSVRRVLGLV